MPAIPCRTTLQLVNMEDVLIPTIVNRLGRLWRLVNPQFVSYESGVALAKQSQEHSEAIELLAECVNGLSPIARKVTDMLLEHTDLIAEHAELIANNRKLFCVVDDRVTDLNTRVTTMEATLKFLSGNYRIHTKQIDALQEHQRTAETWYVTVDSRIEDIRDSQSRTESTVVRRYRNVDGRIERTL